VTAPAEGATPRLPNLIIVGVSKAGTTSLFNYLTSHPDVCGSDIKELRYFSPLRYGEAPGPLGDYAAHFRGCSTQRYAVEATPGYFYGGRALARGLLKTCPEVHAVVSLREPGDRCWSWFQFVKSRTRIPKDMSFTAYLDRCEELHTAGIDAHVEHQPFWGLGGGCYAQWFEDWADEFGDRFQTLFFDDVAAEPRRTMTDLCAWLGIDATVYENHPFPVDNKTELYRNKVFQQAAVALNRRGEAFFHRHAGMKRSLRRLYYTVNRAPAETSMTAAEKARLTAFYRPHNDRLQTQLGARGVQMPASWSRQAM
jgi:hypothetical protein